MRRLFALVALIALLLTSGIAHASAQSSPSGDGTPIGMEFPDPSICKSAPASLDHLKALFDAVKTANPATPTSDASMTEPTPPAGQPADAKTIAEINDTFREFVACINGGDRLRTFAFLSDAKISGDFAVDVANGLNDISQLADFFEAKPTPLDPSAQAPYVPNQDLRLLPDGRVAWVTPDEVLIWINLDSRWLIDDQFDLSPSGTPTP